jgi:hypothetical protein
MDAAGTRVEGLAPRLYLLAGGTHPLTQTLEVDIGHGRNPFLT